MQKLSLDRTGGQSDTVLHEDLRSIRKLGIMSLVGLAITILSAGIYIGKQEEREANTEHNTSIIQEHLERLDTVVAQMAAVQQKQADQHEEIEALRNELRAHRSNHQ